MKGSIAKVSLRSENSQFDLAQLQQLNYRSFKLNIYAIKRGLPDHKLATANRHPENASARTYRRHPPVGAVLQWIWNKACHFESKSAELCNRKKKKSLSWKTCVKHADHFSFTITTIQFQTDADCQTDRVTVSLAADYLPMGHVLKNICKTNGETGNRK